MVARIVSILLVALVFFVCAGVVFWYALVHTVHRGTLMVPDLRGSNLTQAQQVAHDLGLGVELDEDGVFSASVPAGAIAAQDPHPGFHVKAGSSVRVHLSLGGERVAIPDLGGQSLQAALRALEQVDLRPGLRAQVRAQAPADSVLATEPPGGTDVPPGSEVQLLVNITPSRELWVMPSMVSRPLSVVRRFCRQAHLRLGQVHDVVYPGIPSGVVLRQYPPSGSPLSRSDIITVWVSR